MFCVDEEVVMMYKAIIDRPGEMAFGRCKIICLILW